MPYTSTYEESGIHFVMTGEVTASDLFSLEEELYNSKEFPSLIYIIIDYSNAISFEMNRDEVKEAASRDIIASHVNHNLKIAVVSHDVKLIDALLQYNEYYGGHHWESSLHNTLDEARKWIAKL